MASSSPASIQVIRGGHPGPAPEPEEVHDLCLRAFADPPLGDGPQHAQLFAELYEQSSTRPDVVIAQARDGGGRLVGACYGHPWTWEHEQDAWSRELWELLDEAARLFLEESFAVVLLAVDPANQGRGVGTELLDAVLDAAPSRRAWLVTADADTPALRFYLGRGWRAIGRGPDTPSGDPGIVLGLPLR